jgi:hypothetical protein
MLIIYQEDRLPMAKDFVPPQAPRYHQVEGYIYVDDQTVLDFLGAIPLTAEELAKSIGEARSGIVHVGAVYDVLRELVRKQLVGFKNKDRVERWFTTSFDEEVFGLDMGIETEMKDN